MWKKLNYHNGFLSYLQNSTANSAHLAAHFYPESHFWYRNLPDDRSTKYPIYQNWKEYLKVSKIVWFYKSNKTMEHLNDIHPHLINQEKVKEDPDICNDSVPTAVKTETPPAPRQAIKISYPPASSQQQQQSLGNIKSLFCCQESDYHSGNQPKNKWPQGTRDFKIGLEVLGT